MKGQESSGAGRPGWFRAAGWLAALSMLAVAVLAPSATLAKDTRGNNGTVKIHEGATEDEPIVHNDPHVCTFHLHFFFGDDEQAGTWEIQEWSPGDKGVVVLSGSYDTQGDGEDRQPAQGVYELTDGHYKLFWDGDLDTDKHDKHKVFWVDCAQAAPSGSTAPIESGVPSQPPAPSGSTAPIESAVPSQSPAPSASIAPIESVQPSESVAPSGSVAPTESASPSESASGGVLPIETVIPSPTGEVEGIVGTPRPTGQDLGAVGGGGAGATLPPTDLEGAAQPSDGSWRALLVAMAALLAAILIVTPSPATRRR